MINAPHAAHCAWQDMSPPECCPSCKGRRLLATREERDHRIDGIVYTGFVRVTGCKSCRAVFRDPEEEAAFVRAAERVASGEARTGDRQVVRRGHVHEGPSSRGVPSRKRAPTPRSELSPPTRDAAPAAPLPPHRPVRSR